MPLDSVIIQVYHDIIEYEHSQICRRHHSLPPYIQNDRFMWSPAGIKSYLASRYKASTLRAVLDKILNYLIEEGYIIRVSPPDEEARYRTIHMDIALRSARIRTKYEGPPYVVSPRIYLYRHKMPSKNDRKYSFSTKNNQDISKFRGFLRGMLGEKYANILFTAFDAYLKGLGSGGLDIFQLRTLSRMVMDDKPVHVLQAPTGSGKTIIFLGYTLIKLLESRKEGSARNAVFVYPRKTLTGDQMERTISFILTVNRYMRNNGLPPLTVGIFDGDTPKKSNIEVGKSYRGLSYKGMPLVYGTEYVRCGGRPIHEIIHYRERMETEPPDILLLNPWSLETRIRDNKYLKFDYFQRTGVYVFDETHEYRGIRGGITAQLIETLRDISKDTRIVLSSATLPHPAEVGAKLTGVATGDVAVHAFREITKKATLGGERLVMVAVYPLDPNYSWSTYIQLWSIMMMTLYYAYTHSGKNMFCPQSIVFINNLKELNATDIGIDESMRMGEPKDHLNKHPEDLYSYKHFFVGKRLSLPDVHGRVKEYRNLRAKISSAVPREVRAEAIRKLKDRKIALLLGTSSLELGVDYEGVSFIINYGLENPMILAQRIGRGGRTRHSLNTALAIVIVKNTPTEMIKIATPNLNMYLDPMPNFSSLNEKILITRDNPRVRMRGILMRVMTKMVERGIETYTSKVAHGEDITNFLSAIKDILGGDASE